MADRSQGSGPPSSGSDAGDPGEKLANTAGRVADRVGDVVGQQVEARTNAGFDRAGTMLDHVADAVERAGNDLRQDEAPVADLAETAAGRLRTAADYVRSGDMGSIVDGAEDFARRQPAVFLGGAIAIGLLASRFLKASPPAGAGDAWARSRTDGFSAGMSSGYRAYGGYRSEPRAPGRQGTSIRGGGMGYGSSAAGVGIDSTAGMTSRSAAAPGGLAERKPPYGAMGRGETPDDRP